MGVGSTWPLNTQNHIDVAVRNGTGSSRLAPPPPPPHPQTQSSDKNPPRPSPPKPPHLLTQQHHDVLSFICTFSFSTF